MSKCISLSVLFISFCLLVCDQSVIQNATEITTLNVTTDAPWKLRHNGNVLDITNTTRTDTSFQNQAKLRMVTLCRTPNDDNAYCMHLKDCPKLLNQIGNDKARKFLQQSRCGPKNENSKNPKMCCGKYDNYKHLIKNEDPLPKKCGYQNITMRSRILGGKSAKIGEFPWMARLIHKNKQNVTTFGCAGFLIAQKFVLTAAHCLKSENAKMLGPIFEVVLGEHDTDTKKDCNDRMTVCADPPQVIRIKKKIVHPNYNISSQNHHYDIGLIHLKKAAKLSKYVVPICLIRNFDFEPFEYYISGWGSTKYASVSSVKMKLLIPPYPHSNCTELYKLVTIQVNDNQICAGGKKNRDSCTGDSGGPLMVVRGSQWSAAGIVSFGLGCGREGWPGIYTNITSYLPWIQRTILKRVTST